MPSPRMRLSVRRMMTAIAAAALLLGAGRELQRLSQRRAYFLGQAEAWAQRVEDVDEGRMCLHDGITAKWDENPVPRGQLVPKNHIVHYYGRLRAYFAETERSYRFAADRPWRSVEQVPEPSDDPEP